MIYFHLNTSIYSTTQVESLQHRMLGHFNISKDVMEHHIVPKLDAETLLLLSMAGKDLLKFVDSAGCSVFISAMKRGLHLNFRKTFISKQLRNDKDENDFMGIVQIKSLRDQLKTLRSFHVMNGHKIPLTVTGEYEGEEYMFSDFEVQSAYMPAQHKKFDKNTTLRKYNFKMLGKVTHKKLSTPGPEKMELLPNVKIDLSVKNVLICQTENARQHYVQRCKGMCRTCNRNTAEFITYHKVLEKRHQKICKACRDEFFVTLKDMWTIYSMKFDEERARKDVKDIQISYVPGEGYANTMIKFMYKENVAKIAGFPNWTTMVQNWPRAFRRDLKMVTDT